MSELYADFATILSVAQELEGVLAKERVWENYTGYKSVNSSAGIIVPLQAAKDKAGNSRSLVEYGFYDEIGATVEAARTCNDKLAQIVKFLNWLVEQHELLEAQMVSWLGDAGMFPQSEKAWVEDYLNPLGTTHEGGIGNSSFIDFNGVAGEADQYGFELCFMRHKTTTTSRDETGQRVTTSNDVKIGCVGLTIGGRTLRHLGYSQYERPRGARYSPEEQQEIQRTLERMAEQRTNKTGPNSDGGGFSATGLSFSTGRSDDAGNAEVSVGVGKGYTFIHTTNPDGSYQTTIDGVVPYVGGTLGSNETTEQRAQRRAAYEREVEFERTRKANDPAWRAYWAGLGPKPMY